MSIPQDGKTFNGQSDGSFSQSPKQFRLWDQPKLDPTERLKNAMRTALEGCSLSREKVVNDMNRLAGDEGMTCGGRGQKVTLEMLNKWCAPGSLEHRIPIQYLSLFCFVVGSTLPLQALALPIGAKVITEEEAKILDWGKVEISRRKLGRDARRLAQEVGIK